MGRTRTFDVDEALEVALETFWQRGFDATSMQTLCQTIDIQPGSLYAAFGNKRALFVAAVRRYMESVSAEAVDRINSASSGAQGLRDYFDHLIEAMIHGRRRWGCLVTNSLIELTDRDSELAAMFQQHLANLRISFAGALARARAEGNLRPGVGPESADLLVAVVQGMNVIAKTKPGRATLDAIADAALAGLLISCPD